MAIIRRNKFVRQAAPAANRSREARLWRGRRVDMEVKRASLRRRQYQVSAAAAAAVPGRHGHDVIGTGAHVIPPGPRFLKPTRTLHSCRARRFIYILYSPHYSGRENKRTRNTTKQKNKQVFLYPDRHHRAETICSLLIIFIHHKLFCAVGQTSSNRNLVFVLT